MKRNLIACAHVYLYVLYIKHIIQDYIQHILCNAGRLYDDINDVVLLPLLFTMACFLFSFL